MTLDTENKFLYIMYGDECLQSMEDDTYSFVESTNDGDWVYPGFVKMAVERHIKKMKHDNDPEFLVAVAELD